MVIIIEQVTTKLETMTKSVNCLKLTEKCSSANLVNEKAHWCTQERRNEVGHKVCASSLRGRVTIFFLKHLVAHKRQVREQNTVDHHATRNK